MLSKLRFTLFCLILVICSSCTIMKDANPMPTTNPANQERSFSDFSFLKPGMSYDEIKTHVGPADREIGSGLHIFVYQLSDGRDLRLIFAYLDNLAGAKLYDPKTETFEEVILEDDQS